MASFDEKVEALKRLRDRKLAREAQQSTPAAHEAAEAAAGDVVASSAAEERSPAVDTSAEAPRCVDAVAGLESSDLPEIFERYAGLFGSSQACPVSGAGSGELASADKEGEEADDEGAALFCMGHCFEQGIHDCEQDVSKAAVYYKLASEKGSAVAQWRLGHLHEFGQGVEQDDEWAGRWYRLAAEAGHPQAQSSLALLIEDCRIEPRDGGEGLRWHLAAAAQGQALSQYCAACAMSEGRGVERDEATATALLKKSADAGFPPAVKTLTKGGFHADEDCSHADEDGNHEVAGDESSGSLLDIASRVAKQMGNLSDAEAEAFLDDLFDTVGDSTGFSDEELFRALPGAGAFEPPARSAVAA